MKRFKTWAISLLFNDADIIEKSLTQYLATTDSETVETQHVFVWQHWPLEKKSTEKRCRNLSDALGAIWIDPGRNLGLHDGFNLALQIVPIPMNALVIGYDPDCYPVTPGWDRAMCEVFVSDPSIAWMSLWHQHAQRELVEDKRGLEQTRVAGHRLRVLKSPALNSVCGFRRDWLESVHGLHEGNKYYGGLECTMWEKLQSEKKRWVFLEDFKEEPRFQEIQNALYREWKWLHAVERTVQVDFETWVNSKSPLS